MKIEIEITSSAIDSRQELEGGFSGAAGATVEFCGIVRDQENGEKISALEYEAYSPMAENEIRRILEALNEESRCLAARVVHRVGIIPAGEAAIYVAIAAPHRGEAFTMLAEFMNRLKRDVPIWKRRALPVSTCARPPEAPSRPQKKIQSLDDALAEILHRCQPRPGVRVPLLLAAGTTLLEAVSATEDIPENDRSTRDGFAILQDDASPVFQIVDKLHAADWRPRQLKTGETVRVATGTALPCTHLRVIMQEDVERSGDIIKIVSQDSSPNVRRRGTEMRAGQPVLIPGTRLNAGALALLATVGCTQPLVSPRLRVLHFTTGDELVPPGRTPLPGQIRDSNSSLIRGLLHPFASLLWQLHLPEDFARAKLVVEAHRAKVELADLLLVSGGASVGDKDFTRELLEFLNFEIVFHRLSLRPGAPLMFGVQGGRIAFGLPGNPLAHFVVWHVFIAPALARLTGATPPDFATGTLSSPLTEADCPRETLWPARCQIKKGTVELTPLSWGSSGDVSCLATANALIRVPAGTNELPAGARVEFLPITF